MAIGLASARASGEMDKVQEHRERERAQRGRERGKEGGREGGRERGGPVVCERGNGAYHGSQVEKHCRSGGGKGPFQGPLSLSP